MARTIGGPRAARAGCLCEICKVRSSSIPGDRLNDGSFGNDPGPITAARFPTCSPCNPFTIETGCAANLGLLDRSVKGTGVPDHLQVVVTRSTADTERRSSREDPCRDR